MPFMYEDELEWEDLDEEPPRPRPDQFEYSSPPVVMLDQPKQEGLSADREITQDWVSYIVEALRNLGVRKAYCRYDGGNDEGFAWLDHVVQPDGRRLDAKALAKLLLERKAVDIEMMDRTLSKLYRGHSLPKLEMRLDWMISLCVWEWASLLLHPGFGIGDHYIYGAFTVDLETGVIIDDPDAAPVSRVFDDDDDGDPE